MKKLQLIEFKLFLRTSWIFIGIVSVLHVVISDGYIGLKQGFDWSFLQEPASYFKFVFYLIGWTAFEYFIFWRLNPAFREKMREKYEAKKDVEDKVR
ncbi:hypothetical protein [Algoriphagus sp.]|jgi:hypothetical protein|uniref:hypothetical protein n=1 Tax=Algoriphagus sp. TaxID=1872435 RepID=UPI002726CBC7|nr:hypothetical protein [Algoriphagus sp.]MDO8967775.1 hypothetical protein [Algoriphagus sp.]MDP3200582.1 hypothetical protein [Algoriphagus sp.]